MDDHDDENDDGDDDNDDYDNADDDDDDYDDERHGNGDDDDDDYDDDGMAMAMMTTTMMMVMMTMMWYFLAVLTNCRKTQEVNTWDAPVRFELLPDLSLLCSLLVTAYLRWGFLSPVAGPRRVYGYKLLHPTSLFGSEYGAQQGVDNTEQDTRKLEAVKGSV
nr:hypothetical protein BaRGS_016951 [Batillaria attramentaria]